MDLEKQPARFHQKSFELGDLEIVFGRDGRIRTHAFLGSSFECGEPGECGCKERSALKGHGAYCMSTGPATRGVPLAQLPAAHRNLRRTRWRRCSGLPRWLGSSRKRAY